MQDNAGRTKMRSLLRSGVSLLRPASICSSLAESQSSSAAQTSKARIENELEEIKKAGTWKVNDSPSLVQIWTKQELLLPREKAWLIICICSLVILSAVYHTQYRVVVSAKMNQFLYNLNKWKSI